jgi:hypothetical protein
MTCPVAKNPLSALLFIIYVIVNVLLLLNLLLAAVYASYRSIVMDNATAMVTMRLLDLHNAFALLDKKRHGTLPLSVIKLLFNELNQYKLVRHIDMNRAQHYFNLLDKTGRGYITEPDFYSICDVLHTTFTTFRRRRLLERLLPRLQTVQAYRRVRHIFARFFEYFIDAVIVANLVVVAIETTYFDDNDESDPTRRMMSNVEMAFTVFYVVEMLGRMLVLGWSRYWIDYTNRFDFLITMVG